MSFRGKHGAALTVSFMLCACAWGADRDMERCADVADRGERLACYDQLERARRVDAGAGRSYLDEAWKLGPADRDARRIADILTYRPNYILSRWTSRTNPQPRSPAAGRAPLEDVDHDEIKVQGSFKTELVSRAAFERIGVRDALAHVGIDSVRLWFAYTQKMNWQAFNHGEARPIRDANYEPELLLTLGTRNRGDGLKLVNLGLSHESNGLDPAEHRGWSRAYVQGGWEWGRFSTLARAWHIVQDSDDDNPNIRRFMGSGDVQARYQAQGGYVATALVRRNPGTHRGIVALDWATPVRQVLGGLKLHLQLTSGYGDTLIDYNHHQTTLGIGVSFGD